MCEFIGDTLHFSTKDCIMMETSPSFDFHVAHSSFFWTAFYFLIYCQASSLPGDRLNGYN